MEPFVSGERPVTKKAIKGQKVDEAKEVVAEVKPTEVAVTELEVNVTRQTLEETPPRALKLLRAIGMSLLIRAAMASRGYTEADHAEGWALLHAASGFSSARTADPTFDAGVRDAIAAIDASDEDLFRLVRASLQRRYPDQLAVLLDGVVAETGPAAVVAVKTFLVRLDALSASMFADDKAAVALLTSRGVTAEERARLHTLVQQAETAAAVPVVDTAANEALEGAHSEALARLRVWYEEWSEIARVAVKRRDLLILLGLAKRKPPKKKPAAPPAK